MSGHLWYFYSSLSTSMGDKEKRSLKFHVGDSASDVCWYFLYVLVTVWAVNIILLRLLTLIGLNPGVKTWVNFSYQFSQIRVHLLAEIHTHLCMPLHFCFFWLFFLNTATTYWGDFAGVAAVLSLLGGCKWCMHNIQGTVWVNSQCSYCMQLLQFMVTE